MSPAKWLAHVIVHRETPAQTRMRLYAELRRSTPEGPLADRLRSLQDIANGLEAAGDPKRAGWIRNKMKELGHHP